MTSSIKDIMSEDHRYCDSLFLTVNEAVVAEDWNRAAIVLNHLIDDFNFHFDYEENSLFTAFEEQSGTTHGPTQVMRDEHRKIREIFSQLKAAISDSNQSDYYGIFETLNIFIQQHNIKEENILYPMIDTQCDITDALVSSIVQKMNSRAA